MASPQSYGVESFFAPGVTFVIVVEENTGSPSEGRGGTLLGPLT